jgi:hypothetical protein
MYWKYRGDSYECSNSWMLTFDRGYWGINFCPFTKEMSCLLLICALIVPVTLPPPCKGEWISRILPNNNSKPVDRR